MPETTIENKRPSLGLHEPEKETAGFPDSGGRPLFDVAMRGTYGAAAAAPPFALGVTAKLTF